MAGGSLDASATVGSRNAAAGGAWRRIWRLVAGYYGSEERRSAWGLTLAALAFILLEIAVQVRLSLCNRDLFDALEGRDAAAFLGQMGVFAGLVLAGIGAAV